MKTLLFLLFIAPISCLAQFTITGRVLSKTDKKPIENVSVFLSNATTGDKTAADGSFTLHNVKPGKYDLVVTDVAYETYSQPLIVEGRDIRLPDIVIAPQTRSLQEVKIQYHADPDRSRYLERFIEAFIGNSDRARDCKLINPEVLDLKYDKEKQVLTASSADFLVIENDALGYRIKYLLNDFWLRDSLSHQQIRYQGYTLFEEMKGSARRKARWQRAREDVYGNSAMHFFRAAIADKLEENNFRVEKLAEIPNRQRPPDSLIAARIRYFKTAEHSNRDSLAFWNRKEKLPRIFRKLLPDALRKRDIIAPAGRNLYALYCDNCNLVVGYNTSHRFHIDDHIEYYYNRGNTDNTFVKFNSPEVPVYAMGVLSDPYSLSYDGVWGRSRVAELLPIDYEPVYAIENTAGQDLILAKLDSFSARHIAEKAYLQFDKPYYAAGDTLYFKAYVTMNERHVPSQISGVLHVDLVNTKGKIDQSIKLKLADGVGWGDFALPDSLPKGNYRMRAWTEWMRNDSGFFEKTIPVGSLQNAKVTESGKAYVAVSGKPDVQFFPEGGSLVAGVRSKIAFKAIGANGLGMGVSGEVLDNDNKQVVSFASVHLGMGSFEFMPGTGKSYHAELTLANGTKQTIELPKVENQGIALSVNNDSIPVAKVRIEASPGFFKENKGKEFTLLIYSGGIATSVPCALDSTMITLEILKRKLFTGVTRITLFSHNNEPLCERLIFVQNYDQLNLEINSDKSGYAPREKVNLKLSARTRADSAATGHFSIAVTDESKVPADENSETTILTDQLLTSDLKGYVEQPNYYFSHITDTTAKNLDLVMLTHGYRRFEWKEILNNSQQPAAYRPENGLSINGTVKTVLGKPVAKGMVSLITYIGGPVRSETTDEKGNFKFGNLAAFSDTGKFVLTAITDKGKNSTVISYNKQQDEPPVAPQLVTTGDTTRNMSSYLQSHKEQWDQYAKYGLPGGRLLKEVKIKAVKRDDNYPSSSLLGPGHADQVIHGDEIGKFGGQLSDILNGRLIGVKFVSYSLGNTGIPHLQSFNTGHMLIVVDGVALQDSSIDRVNPQSVETVEVLRFVGSSAIYGMDGGNGVIVITTKQGKGLDPKDIASKGILPIAVQGFYKARQFYTPKYEHPTDNPNRKDLRSTIYWQPEVATDKDGNASISFYNADGKGNYRVVVEGIDEKGNIGRQVYRYKVE